MNSLLQASSAFVVRIVCAPLGFGKSSMLEDYMASRNGVTFDVRSLIARSPGNADSIFNELPTLTPLVVLDNFDAASPAAIDALIDRLVAGQDKRQYILSGRSPQRMRVSRILASGLGVLLDANALAFTIAEAAQLADLHNLRYDNEDLAQLLHDTDGWTVAVHWVVRFAVQNGGHLRGAFETWWQSRGHLFLEYLAGEHRTDIDEYLRFTVLLRRGFQEEGEALHRFEALGFPIVRSRAVLRAYRVLSRLASSETVVAPCRSPAAHPLMTLKALGRFRCEIDGHEIKFVRRRDQNVLTFVALSPKGRVTRQQLIDAFWPGTERNAAAQGLRTTLSRIRQAIGKVSGPESVDAYFRSGVDVCIDGEHVALDFRRFLEHVALGEIAEAKGDAAGAKRSFAAADRLYVDQLLASEAVASCFAPRVAELEEKYVTMLVRLVALHDAENEHTAAEVFVGKLLRRGALSAPNNGYAAARGFA